ncbi:MAG: ribonuclease H-like domain-containing protein [Pseudomonadota bacterium]
MLANTFIHMPGIGPATEKKLWQSNINAWTDKDRLSRTNLSCAKAKAIEAYADQSIQHLKNNNPNFFENLLPSSQHFRLFPEFRQSCAYLDIETTGLNASARITTIAIYDGREIKYFVQGKNLSDFLDHIQEYKVLITYNGRCFDIPFIENYFHVRLPHCQIDLRYILQYLGFKGGLKKCEKAMGIDREDLDGVDGYFAVLLWENYIRTGNTKALDTLLAYNIEDVINLEGMMVQAYNLHIEHTPFFRSHKIQTPLKPKNPLKADKQTIQSIKRQYY